MTLVRARKARRAAGAVGEGGEAVRASYASDPYRWAVEQAELLRTGRLDLIDVQNIADEIADVARREVRAARSSLRLILQHLLKWDHQPERRSRSWALSIREHRREARLLFDENPGMRPQSPLIVEQAYAGARDAALSETGLREDDLPTVCPYAWDDIMNRPIQWPDPS